LPRTLATFRDLEPPSRPWGLLLVTNNCTDNTLEQLKSFAKTRPDRLPLRWEEAPIPGKSNALNQAIPLLTSDLTAFVDDDHRVAKDYLEQVCAAAEQYPEAGLFCGRILPDWDGSEPDWIHDQGPYRIYPLPVPRFDQGEEPKVLTPEVAIPGGGNLFLRTSWLHKTGPFSTDLGPVGHDLGGSEDLDWILRAQGLGAVLQYVPAVVQYHYVNTSRFTVPYMMKKSYTRSASIIGLEGRKDRPGVPRYLYRKLAQYLFKAMTALNQDRRRFYLIRTAAALGEIKGHREWKAKPVTTQSQETPDS
ncbi:MAG TPA: glycosyltransferase, partial [Chromatiaceae bacterium]|nr:glycosyltransferase [Chromatiaceae bacterium]